MAVVRTVEFERNIDEFATSTGPCSVPGGGWLVLLGRCHDGPGANGAACAFGNHPGHESLMPLALDCRRERNSAERGNGSQTDTYRRQGGVLRALSAGSGDLHRLHPRLRVLNSSSARTFVWMACRCWGLNLTLENRHGKFDSDRHRRRPPPLETENATLALRWKTNAL